MCGGVAADLEAGISSMVSDSLTHCFAFAVPCAAALDAIAGLGCGQGLTLVHFSAQLEPCPTHKFTLHTL